MPRFGRARPRHAQRQALFGKRRPVDARLTTSQRAASAGPRFHGWSQVLTKARLQKPLKSLEARLQRQEWSNILSHSFRCTGVLRACPGDEGIVTGAAPGAHAGPQLRHRNVEHLPRLTNLTETETWHFDRQHAHPPPTLNQYG
jgi:hypothetical protein